MHIPSLTLSHRYEIRPLVAEMLQSDQQMVINGQQRSSSTGETIDVFEPSSGELLTRIPAASEADVDHAVKSARDAFEGPWSQLKPYDRQQLILRLADLMEQHADDLAQLESLDNGKPASAARVADIEGAIRYFRYMAGWATKIEGETKSLSFPSENFAFTRKEPVGVVGAIIPWNFPLSMAAWKVAPALASGCTIVLKPAENTPLTALMLADLARQAGIPDGVFNVITGYGHVAGAALAAHPGINKIAFTGSTRVGKLIGHAAMDNITRTSLELGGKSPVIVLKDADIQRAAKGAADAIFFNAGQVCCAGSRLYVHRSIYDQVVTEVAHIANSIKLAPGLDATCQMGPLISQQQQETVLKYIDIGIQEGATLAAGGTPVEGSGYFVRPTVLADTNQNMTCVREEIFGPVLVAQPFDEIEEVIALANDSPYGLGASIWSNDLIQVHRMISRIEAGTVWVNTHNVVDASLPFGGFKQSGIGREQGREQLELFLETKSVWIEL